MKKLIALALSVSSIALIGAAMAATPASASVVGAFCPTAPVNHICPSRYPDGTEIKGENTSVILFKMGFAEAECHHSTFAGKIRSEGTIHNTLVLTSFTMQQCSVATETLQPAIWYFPWAEGTHNAAGGYGFTELKFSYLGTNCVYDVPAGMSLTGGSPANIVINGNISKVSGGFACANPAAMTAFYKVTSPSSLYVEKE